MRRRALLILIAFALSACTPARGLVVSGSTTLLLGGGLIALNASIASTPEDERGVYDLRPSNDEYVVGGFFMVVGAALIAAGIVTAVRADRTPAGAPQRATAQAVAGTVSVNAPPSAVAYSTRIPAANPPASLAVKPRASVADPPGFTHGAIIRVVR